MNKTIIYKNSKIEIYLDIDKDILFIDIIDGNYNKNNFNEALEYYKNFWILINNSDKKYYQVFIFNNVNFYPLEFYDLIFKTLKNLEEIFKEKLYSSCLINNSNAIDILKPLLNLYKAIRPFRFVRTKEEGYKFLYENN